MNAVIYARYSSHGQTEQSIEGQLKACYEYAKKNGYNVIREPYIDRAQSGTSDKREKFQRMINDSAKEQFEVILVYQLDRFARNRYDSAIYKNKLKKNSVKVISVRENLTDDASGVFMEAVLEGMAEYYSTELSQKVKRGIAISVGKCKFIGGFIPLGYALTEDKYFIIDQLTAPIVTRIFELYVSGYGLKEIAGIIKTEFNKDFGNPFNAIGHILDNVNYIGTYTRGGNIVENAMPRLISDELFQQVQARRMKQKKAPATARAYENYLLTTKLYCGYDREMMVGTGGTSKSGAVHHYYSCKNVLKKKGCKKKNVKKTYIEDFIVSEARKQLTDCNIEMIVDAVCEVSKKENSVPYLAELKRNIKENEKAIENLLVAIERGENLDLLMERLTKKKQEKANLEASLAKAQMDTIELDEKEVKFFFHKLQKGDIDDERTRKALIAIFINEVYLYDDKVRIIFNASERPVEIDYELLNDIESLENGGVSESGRCSYMKDTSPPNKKALADFARAILL